jgi:hypothetical protein
LTFFSSYDYHHKLQEIQSVFSTSQKFWLVQRIYIYIDDWLRRSWPWSHGSWILQLLMQSVFITTDVVNSILIWARCTTLCDKVCQWLATGRWFSPGPPVSCTNKTDRHDIIEILLKVALNSPWNPRWPPPQNIV